MHSPSERRAIVAEQARRSCFPSWASFGAVYGEAFGARRIADSASSLAHRAGDRGVAVLGVTPALAVPGRDSASPRSLHGPGGQDPTKHDAGGRIWES